MSLWVNEVVLLKGVRHNRCGSRRPSSKRRRCSWLCQTTNRRAGGSSAYFPEHRPHTLNVTRKKRGLFNSCYSQTMNTKSCDCRCYIVIQSHFSGYQTGALPFRSRLTHNIYQTLKRYPLTHETNVIREASQRKRKFVQWLFTVFGVSACDYHLSR